MRVLDLSYHPLDCRSGRWVDLSRKGNHGTPYGGARPYMIVPGVMGYWFNGSSGYVDCENASLRVIGGGFPAFAYQGVATDGEYVYTAVTHNIFKYDMEGNWLADSSYVDWHIGGITYHDGYIYAVVSECSSSGTTKHWVYKYDTNLNKVAEYDIGDYFTICVGAIAYYDGHFYVAESYFDNEHYDKIVKFDTSFNYVETIEIPHKCEWGIQGIEYIASKNLFQINCHSRQFYRINTSFDSSTIKIGLSPFTLQDLAYLNDSVSIYVNPSASRVEFVDNNLLQTFADLIKKEYTIQTWFNVMGGAGTRRFIFESYWFWAISCEITDNKRLAYYIQTDGTSVIKETDRLPSYGAWHCVTIVYKQDNYSKIFYDGIELSDYTGAPSGMLKPFFILRIGTYRYANGRWFKGLIAQPVIENRAWSEAEVRENMYRSPIYRMLRGLPHSMIYVPWR